MIKINSEKGFSLAEVMVAAGLVGIISLGVIYGSKVANKQKRSASAKLAVQAQLNIDLKHLSNFSKGVSWNNFDFDATYFVGNDMKRINRVSWKAKDVTTISNRTELRRSLNTKDYGVVNYFKDSHTLDSSIGSVGSALYFTRCIGVNPYRNNRRYSLQEALNINMRPFLIKNGKHNEIHCLPRKTSGVPSANTRVSGNNSSYRVVSFYFKNRSLLQMPSAQERRFLLGAGFSLLMNRSKNPDGFTAYNFVLDDPCLRYETDGECKRNAIVELRNITGAVQAAGVHDSGFMVIQ